MSLADRICSTLSANPAPFWVLRRLHDNGGAVREALRELAEQGRVTRDDTTELYHLASESPEEPAPAWGAPDPGEADVAAEVTASVSAGLATVKRASLWTTPAAPGAGGLPASKIPGLEDEIRVLTLDDVAEPAPEEAARLQAILDASPPFRPTAEQLAWARSLPSPEGAEPPPPPRGHPAHGVGPSWLDRIAALEVRVARIDSEQAQQRNSIAAIETVGLHEIARRVARLEHPEPVGPVMTPPGVHVEAKREREAVVAYLRAMPIAFFGSADEADRMCNITAHIEAGLHLVKP